MGWIARLFGKESSPHFPEYLRCQECGEVSELKSKLTDTERKLAGAHHACLALRRQAAQLQARVRELEDMNGELEDALHQVRPMRRKPKMQTHRAKGSRYNG